MVLPVFAYAQQQEPKRIKVVVVAREIARPEQIIQLPATNVPIESSRKTNVYKKIRRTANPLTKATFTKPPRLVEIPIEKSKKIVWKAVAIKEKAKNPAPLQRTEITKSGVVTVGKENQPAKAVNVKTIAPEKATQTITQNAVQPKKTLVAGDTTQVKAKDVTETKRGIAPNALSYIWIGVFLVIAGLVLGLLFGKPAFLVSFAGLVFLILGFLI